MVYSWRKEMEVINFQAPWALGRLLWLRRNDSQEKIASKWVHILNFMPDGHSLRSGFSFCDSSNAPLNLPQWFCHSLLETQQGTEEKTAGHWFLFCHFSRWGSKLEITFMVMIWRSCGLTARWQPVNNLYIHVNIVYIDIKNPAHLKEYFNFSKSWLQGMDPSLHFQKKNPVFRNREEPTQRLNKGVPASTCIFLKRADLSISNMELGLAMQVLLCKWILPLFLIIFTVSTSPRKVCLKILL